MATWKKIITSGSSAELSSLTLDTALPVAQGGIGATSLTDKAVLISQDSGTDAIGAVALTSNGQIIIGGSGGPAAATISGTSNEIGITNGANSITIGLTDDVTIPQDLTVTRNISNSSAVSDSHLTGSFSGSFTGTFDGQDNLVDVSGTPSNNQIAIFTDANTIEGDADITFDGTDMLLGGSAGTTKLQFRDATEFINSSTNGQLDIVAATEVEITATTIDIDGNVDISGNTVIGGDLTVNGTTTTVATTNTQVKDQFLLLASGSSGTNVDAGILVQSGSTPGTGSAFYHDISDQRWSVGKSLDANRTAATTPTQFVTTVKTDTVNPSSTSGSYGAGEMHVNTSTGEIWIRFG
tara:strand:- start:16 stop:1074 length:1059 start_codon:yes stop_codon:yes gene_type:complete